MASKQHHVHFLVRDADVLPARQRVLHLTVPAAALVRAAGERVVVGRVHEDALRAQRRVERRLVLPLPLHAVLGAVVVVVRGAARRAAVGAVGLDHRQPRVLDERHHLLEQPAVPARREARGTRAAAGGGVDRVVALARERQRDEVVAADLDAAGVRVGDGRFHLRPVDRVRRLKVEATPEGEDDHVKTAARRHNLVHTRDK